MKTDRELLELAAKAAGRDVIWKIGMHREGLHEGLFDRATGHVTSWNPLTDDGDAFRLAVKLHISTYRAPSGMVMAISADGNANFKEEAPDNPYAATRRAIVRAAAAIGEAMA